MSYIQSAINYPDTSVADTTIAQAFSSAITAGSLLVAAVTWRSANDVAGTQPTLADTLGNTWHKARQEDNTDFNGGPNPYYSEALWYTWNSGAGANTVTATFGASIGTRSIIIAEYSGIQTGSDPLDVVNGNRSTDSGTGTDAVTSNTADTTADGDLVIGWGAAYGGVAVQTLTAGSANGFVVRQTSRGVADLVAIALEDGIKTTAGTTSATFTKSVSEGGNDCMMATFKAASSAAANKPGSLLLMWQ